MNPVAGGSDLGEHFEGLIKVLNSDPRVDKLFLGGEVRLLAGLADRLFDLCCEAAGERPASSHILTYLILIEFHFLRH